MNNAPVRRTNKNVGDIASELKTLQNVLQNPKHRGILGEYFLENVLKNVKEKALKDPESKMRRAINAYAGERTKTLFNQWLSEEALVHA